MRDPQFGFAARVTSSLDGNNLKSQFDIDMRCDVKVNYRLYISGVGNAGDKSLKGSAC
jgi:hypothetical protein